VSASFGRGSVWGLRISADLTEIAEAVVVGVPDRIRGEMPVAYVVERTGRAVPRGAGVVQSPAGFYFR
jgi:acyl-CoA synthetase (AMP-forming)/AMP-acid ligase II